MTGFSQKTEKGIRTGSVLVTVITMMWLTYFFSESLISCLLLVWKHTVEGLDVPVLGETRELEIVLIAGGSFCAASMAVYGMRKRLKAVFCGKPGKWYVLLILPLLVVAIVTYAANWGAGYGILYRSGGNMGLYYDQIFSYVGWSVLSRFPCLRQAYMYSAWTGFIWNRKKRSSIRCRRRAIKCWRSSTGRRSGCGMT